MSGAVEIPYRRESATERRRRRWLTALAYVLLAVAVLLAGQFLHSGRPSDPIAVPSSGATPAGAKATGGAEAKAKAASPKTAPKTGPKTSPKVAAKAAPKAAPKGVPKVAAAGSDVASSLGGASAANGAASQGGVAPELAAEHGAVGHAGTFRFVPGYGPVLGRRGPVRRFRVAVEQPASAGTATGFAEQVERVLGDGRSWIAGGRFRLRRVPGSAPAEFTIYLASAGTSERMCRAAGLETGGYTSCRIVGRVIINDDRWENAVRGYGAPLATYRAYAINHEVGHQVGYRHERCPGDGRPAPVMMQQTFGLRGCVANPWPYLEGRRYAGPPAR